ncbi:MAG: deoxyribodipyrimidine photo-lyase, partial [Bacteroidia bacterium]
MPVAFWFRRDLRLDDNTGLSAALQAGESVIPVFVFDKSILDELPEQDARVDFIHRTLADIQTQLRELGSELVVRYGPPTQVWENLQAEYNFTAVYTNHDYEPYAIARDTEMASFFSTKGASFNTYKDQVIFEKEEILTNTGNPYAVFTPYSRKWREQLTPAHLADRNTEAHFDQFWKTDQQQPIPSLSSMGFQQTDMVFPPRIPDKEIIKVYDEKRDFPAEKGTTRVGLHLRFGTLSIRKLARVARKLNDTYLSELIWREFYMQVLWNNQYVVNAPYRKDYSLIEWENNETHFKAWCEGKTGYPLVDAGMRELNATGFMHNRVRMLVASFLSKHLLINWQWGEAYFAEKLLDFELASNNGGWQWAAGCGTDAAPYFRIFNPESQLKKFDSKARYVRKWVPEFGTPAYPKPIV